MHSRVQRRQNACKAHTESHLTRQALLCLRNIAQRLPQAQQQGHLLQEDACIPENGCSLLFVRIHRAGTEAVSVLGFRPKSTAGTAAATPCHPHHASAAAADAGSPLREHQTSRAGSGGGGASGRKPHTHLPSQPHRWCRPQFHGPATWTAAPSACQSHCQPPSAPKWWLHRWLQAGTAVMLSLGCNQNCSAQVACILQRHAQCSHVRTSIRADRF